MNKVILYYQLCSECTKDADFAIGISTHPEVLKAMKPVYVDEINLQHLDTITDTRARDQDPQLPEVLSSELGDKPNEKMNFRE